MYTSCTVWRSEVIRPGCPCIPAKFPRYFLFSLLLVWHTNEAPEAATERGRQARTGTAERHAVPPGNAVYFRAIMNCPENLIWRGQLVRNRHKKKSQCATEWTVGVLVLHSGESRPTWSTVCDTEKVRTDTQTFTSHRTAGFNLHGHFQDTDN